MTITAYVPEEVELEEDDDLDSVYSEWDSATNMTASQLRRWSTNPCSREASVEPTTVIRRNLRLLETNKSDWTTKDIKDAKRTISFIERMGDEENEPDAPKDGANGCPSPWAISLLNWGFNPFSSMPENPDEMDDVDEVTLGQTVQYATEIAVLASIEAGDYVDYGDSDYGLVIEKNTSTFEFPGGDGPESEEVEVDASEDEPVYLIGKSDGGIEPMTADRIEVTERNQIFDESDPDGTDDLGDIDAQEMSVDGENHSSGTVSELATAQDVPGITRTQRGQNPYPESWRESNKPARLILLDAWQSMNMSHTGCVREMRGNVTRPNALCAAFKDSVYGGWTGWRNGGD